MADTKEATIEVLQPGMIIAPQISINTAQKLVEELYKLRVKSIKELNSYDDKNYKVDVYPETDNPHIKKVYDNGYVLKVLNKLDTPKQHVAAEHEAAKVLSKAGISCPLPELNIHGNETSLEKLAIEKQGEESKQENKDYGYSTHLVRLMKYLPGIRLVEVPFTPDILYQCGDLLGHIDKELKGFSHPALTIHDTVWSLGSVPRLTEFIHAVKNEDHKECVLDIIEQFKKEIVPNLHKFQKGVIHGDFNEQNVLVEKCSEDDNQNQTNYRVSSIIDFGDSNETYIAFEIGTALMYLMLESRVVDILDAGGYVLKGYYKHITLNELEKDALKILILGRYCQSLVLGAYSYMQDPGNEYLLVTAKRGWSQLMELWKTPKEKLFSSWERVMEQLP